MNIENNPFLTKRPAPVGTTCRHCGAQGLEIVSMVLSGPFAGSIKCSQCGHSESVMSHLGKKLVTVEPLTTPNAIHPSQRK